MNKRSFFLALRLTLFLVSPFQPLNLSYGEQVFRSVLKERAFSFPKDHGAHKNFSTEWWYFTGHLKTESDTTFGYELTFFRIGIKTLEPSQSKWALDSLYMAHFAITDDRNEKFHFGERASRGNFNDAGAAENKLRVWNGSWKAEMTDEHLTLKAKWNGFGIDLHLKSTKPVVLHGKGGLSKKGPLSGQASYYYSLTRLEGEGEVTVDGLSQNLKHASGWMDHEFTSEELDNNLAGWDWFAIQMDNGEELMLYQLRKKDGTLSPYSSGTWIDKNGKSETIEQADFAMEELKSWKSPKTGVLYPMGWELIVKKRDLSLKILPTLQNQELETKETTGVLYWEGRCTVTGTVKGKPIQGNAYVELVGYDKPVRFRK